jgi:hypothetical protein
VLWATSHRTSQPPTVGAGIQTPSVLILGLYRTQKYSKVYGAGQLWTKEDGTVDKAQREAHSQTR